MKISFTTSIVICLLSALMGCEPDKVKKDDLKNETDGVDKAISQRFRMMKDPFLNIIPQERLEIALNIAKSRQTAAGFRTLALAWAERGPNNIGGRTRTILVDRRDASGNTVLSASVSGGIFRTTTFLSAAPNWSPMDDRMLNLAVTCLLQDRTNGNIMYAGTGEGWFNIDAIRGAGVFKSTDGGTTWSQLNNTSHFEYVQDIEQDMNGNIYASLRNTTASGGRGVQRSADGGITWTQVLGLPLAAPFFTTGRAADLEVASNGDMYATLGIFSRVQVFRSSAAANGTNTGAANTWTNISPTFPLPTSRAELCVSNSNPQRLYLLPVDSASSQVTNIYKSSDAGASWSTVAAPGALNNGNNSQAWYNLISAVDPANQDVLVVGGLDVAKSTDGGNSFINITNGTGVHVDQHALLYTSTSTLLLGNDGGIYYSTNANAASPTFTNKNNGFNITQFYGVDFHPTNTNYFLAGAQDNNTQKFTGAGINSTAPVVGGDGGFPHIDQTDGQLQIAATTNNNYFRSTNGGANWSSVPGNNNRGLFINPTDFDDNLNTLYASDNRGFYYYINNLTGVPSNSTNNITQIGNSREVTAVKVDPFTAQTVWLGASFSFDPSVAPNAVLPVVIRISNANTASPTVVSSSTIGTNATTLGAYLSSIDVDPANPNHILATLSNYGVTSVFESTNAGVNWTSIEGDLPDMPVYWGLFAPANAQLNGATGGNGGILLGTELGVWTSSNIQGASTEWIVNSTSFPNVRTDMLKLRTSDMMVVAATHGRGLFTTNLSVVTGIPTIDNTKDFIKYTSANTQQLFIKKGNLNISKIQIRIFDMKGRLVRSTDTNYNDQFIQISNLAGGSYILKIYGNKGEQYTQQFVK